MPAARDITGQRFGRLVAVKLSGYVAAGREKKRAWECRCDCSAIFVAAQRDICRGDTTSCGCLHKEQLGNMSRTHGLSGARDKTGAYGIWKKIWWRCENVRCKGYPNYGGRGIKVCERWQSFENFTADMGPRPTGYTIERLDVNGNYEPSNCMWLPKAKQSRNRRDTARIEYRGRTIGLPDLCEEVGIDAGAVHTLVYRKRISHQEAFELLLARRIAA